jgi:hypothetical protein
MFSLLRRLGRTPSRRPQTFRPTVEGLEARDLASATALTAATYYYATGIDQPVVFHVGTDRALYEDKIVGTPWQTTDVWKQVYPSAGFKMIAAPADGGPAAPTCFALANGGLYSYVDDGSGFSRLSTATNFTALSATGNSTLSGGSDGVALFALDSSGQVTQYNARGKVTGLPSGVTFTTVAAADNKYGNAVVFAVDTLGRVWENDPGNSAAGSGRWTYLRGPVGFTRISATENVADDLYNPRAGGAVVFAVGRDARLYEWDPEFAGTGWKAISPVCGFRDISAAFDVTGSPMVSAVLGNGGLYNFNYQSSANGSWVKVWDGPDCPGFVSVTVTRAQYTSSDNQTETIFGRTSDGRVWQQDERRFAGTAHLGGWLF